jgi:hypothetical protein
VQRKSWLLIVLSLLAVCLFVNAIVFADDDYNWKEIASWEVDAKGEFVEKGIQLHFTDYDGQYETIEKGGVSAVETVPGEGWMFLYFTIDDDLLYAPPDGTPVKIQVEYFDEGIGNFVMNQTSWKQEYYWTEMVQKKMSNQWDVYDFIITDGKFDKSGHGKFDFRIQAGEKKLAIKKIVVFVTE